MKKMTYDITHWLQNVEIVGWKKCMNKVQTFIKEETEQSVAIT